MNAAPPGEPGFVPILLPRHGSRPVLVMARALVTATWRTSQITGMQIDTRLTLYETQGGGFAAGLAHAVSEDADLKTNDCVPAWRCAVIARDVSSFRAALRAHAPVGIGLDDRLPDCALAAAWHAGLDRMLAPDASPPPAPAP